MKKKYILIGMLGVVLIIFGFITILSDTPKSADYHVTYLSVITQIYDNPNNTMTIGFWKYPDKNKTGTWITIRGIWIEIEKGSCVIQIVRKNDGYWYLEQYDKWVDGQQVVVYATREAIKAFGPTYRTYGKAIISNWD